MSLWKLCCVIVIVIERMHRRRISYEPASTVVSWELWIAQHSMDDLLKPSACSEQERGGVPTWPGTTNLLHPHTCPRREMEVRQWGQDSPTTPICLRVRSHFPTPIPRRDWPYSITGQHCTEIRCKAWRILLCRSTGIVFSNKLLLTPVRRQLR